MILYISSHSILVFPVSKTSGTCTSVTSNCSIKFTAETRGAHLCHCCSVTEVWVQSYFAEGQRDSVSCLFAFPAVRQYAHNRQLVTQGASVHDAPMLLFHSLPPPSWSATWVMTTPGTRSPPCHFCHWISWWLQPSIPCLLFSAHALTLNCTEKELRQLWKKKIDQGPGMLKKK